MIDVLIPTPLRNLTNNQDHVKVDATSISDMINKLDEKCPGIKERICKPDGKVRQFVNIYINDDDMRFLHREDTELKDGDSVSIVPSIAGGIL